jgi:hypothetical protein
MAGITDRLIDQLLTTDHAVGELMGVIETQKVNIWLYQTIDHCLA